MKVCLPVAVVLVFAVATLARQVERSTKKPKPGDAIKNGLSMRLAYIPAGKFRMGSPKSEAGREKQETQHEVELTRGFY